MYGGLLYGAPLHLRYSRRHCHYNSRRYEIPLLCRFLYKVAQHYFGNLEIGYDPDFHRAYRRNVSGGLSKHLFRLFTDGDDFFGIVVHSHDARFARYLVCVFGIHKRICRSEVDSDVV